MSAFWHRTTANNSAFREGAAGRAIISRRRALGAIASAAALAAAPRVFGATSSEKNPAAPYSAINTGTLIGYELPVEKQIELSSRAGFPAIELWARDIEAFLQKGGTYADLKKMLSDSGLKLENIIGFCAWAADDPDERAKGREAFMREMETASELGARHIAATGLGTANLTREKLDGYAERYRELLEFGETLNVTPLIELWGSHTFCRLEDVMYIALAAKHKNASVLLDFYHLYRGGNSFESLALLNMRGINVFHINDYPAYPPREKLTDADRVFPGDGICPLVKTVAAMRSNGFSGALSVELFNKSYWEKYSPGELLKICREKTEAVISESAKIS